MRGDAVQRTSFSDYEGHSSFLISTHLLDSRHGFRIGATRRSLHSSKLILRRISFVQADRSDLIGYVLGLIGPFF
jgi:hypothetical protein